ncbi:cytochrome c [Bradyrhizobium sp. Tv2a-2]|uniref:c-type cytochrome n=1 Tax=Bradyrhizobium sp. Tv2a-2 TaxID=113395 RepID=UPI001FD92A76|nr:cytochrome c [Bradyrhizobium sp. Tv2a-2]
MNLRRLNLTSMKPNPGMLLPALLAMSLGSAMPALAQSANTTPDNASLDVPQLFATTCGWCHSDGGRAAGKGPQLMNTQRNDDFIRNRIKNGKEGAMPAFGSLFNDAQIDQIIKYIRDLKPHEG